MRMASYWGIRGSSVCAKLRCPGRAILGQRNRAQSDHDLAYQRLVERDSGRGESRRRGRVRMHDALHIRPQPVNQQVHGDFARNVVPPGQTPALHIDDHHVCKASSCPCSWRLEWPECGAHRGARKDCRPSPPHSRAGAGAAEQDYLASMLTFAGHGFENKPQAAAVSAYGNATGWWLQCVYTLLHSWPPRPPFPMRQAEIL